MTYEAECAQNRCEFVTRTETEQEAIDVITDHTDEAHANMDILEEKIHENITQIE